MNESDFIKTSKIFSKKTNQEDLNIITLNTKIEETQDLYINTHQKMNEFTFRKISLDHSDDLEGSSAVTNEEKCFT